MCEDYRASISFEIGQRTLLWKTINFVGFFADVKIDCFYHLLWRSETECNIAV